MKRNLSGWIKDKPDDRDYTPETPKVKTTFDLLNSFALPESVDLRQYCSPIEDQGNLGSCTANAEAGAIELIERKQYGKHKDASRLFIYYNTRMIEGTVNYDAGATIRNTIKSVVKYGAATESCWPYDINEFTVKPPLDCYSEALKYQTLTYVSLSTLNDIKTTLAGGLPVQMGILVFESFERIGSDGIMPLPNPYYEELLGGHAVLAVGYKKIDGREYLIMRNSWGDWGDNGYFYMPVDYLNSVYDGYMCCDDFWVILTEEWVGDEPTPEPFLDCKVYTDALERIKTISHAPIKQIGYSKKVTAIKKVLEDVL